MDNDQPEYHPSIDQLKGTPPSQKERPPAWVEDPEGPSDTKNEEASGMADPESYLGPQSEARTNFVNPQTRDVRVEGAKSRGDIKPLK